MTLPLTEKIVDEKLPQMNELTDAPRMCALFQRTLLAATDHHLPDYHLETCRLLRVRYRPGRNCLAAYSLTLTERETGRKFEQMLSVTVYGKGESRERFERAHQHVADHGVPRFAKLVRLGDVVDLNGGRHVCSPLE